jgi:hypothetical protein
MVASVTIVKLELAPARGVRVAGVRPGAAQAAIVIQALRLVIAGRCGLGQRVTAPAAGGIGDGFELVHYSFFHLFQASAKSQANFCWALYTARSRTDAAL